MDTWHTKCSNGNKGDKKMGVYSSRDWTWRKIVRLGFIKPNEIPQRFKRKSPRTGKLYRFYFKYYDYNTSDAEAWLNVGDTSFVANLKRFKYPSEMYKKAVKVGRPR